MVDIAGDGSGVVATFDVGSHHGALLDNTTVDAADDTGHVGVADNVGVDHAEMVDVAAGIKVGKQSHLALTLVVVGEVANPVAIAVEFATVVEVRCTNQGALDISQVDVGFQTGLQVGTAEVHAVGEVEEVLHILQLPEAILVLLGLMLAGAAIDADAVLEGVDAGSGLAAGLALVSAAVLADVGVVTVLDTGGQGLNRFAPHVVVVLALEVPFADLHEASTACSRDGHLDVLVLRRRGAGELKRSEVHVPQRLVVIDYIDNLPVVVVVGAFDGPVHRVTAGVGRVVVSRDDGVSADGHGLRSLDDEVGGQATRTQLRLDVAVGDHGRAFGALHVTFDKKILDAGFLVRPGLRLGADTRQQQGCCHQN